MNTRSSRAFEDLLASSIAPQVMPPWTILLGIDASFWQNMWQGHRWESQWRRISEQYSACFKIYPTMSLRGLESSGFLFVYQSWKDYFRCEQQPIKINLLFQVNLNQVKEASRFALDPYKVNPAWQFWPWICMTVTREAPFWNVLFPYGHCLKGGGV